MYFDSWSLSRCSVDFFGTEVRDYPIVEVEQVEDRFTQVIQVRSLVMRLSFTFSESLWTFEDETNMY
jgi:hypothetical protein